MKGPFTRNCSEIVDELAQLSCLAPVSSSISEIGHESMWCEMGHRIKEWYVLDSEGAKIALAKLHSSPQILDPEMMKRLSIDPMFRSIRPPQPDKLCKRGHNEWYMDTDERYRCRQCKRERYERVRRAKAKYRKRGPKLDPVEVKRREREHKKARYNSDPEFRERRRASSRKYWAKYSAKKKAEAAAKAKKKTTKKRKRAK